ncbi:MAG: NAD+ synthase [Candidatus Latescibacteria bacterium]|nr:NAD+ synthase [bacterium]MBD3423987.1 NAD+ synthase [Candidatus Latescibacterota bacterium]
MNSKTDTIRIAAAQLNTTVGDFEGNLSRIEDSIAKASESGADIIIFPELVICGYPPEDLLFNKAFLFECSRYLRKAGALTKGITAIIGCPEKAESRTSKGLFNTAYIFHDGEEAGRYRKIHLPNYSVFDEKRYFSPGNTAMAVDTGRGKIGITICEDLWVKNSPAQAESSYLGADIIMNLSASPYIINKCRDREKLFKKKAQKFDAAICCCNLIGGQDELIFDGSSHIIDRYGKTVSRAKPFQEDLIVADLQTRSAPRRPGKSHDGYDLEVINIRKAGGRKKRKNIKPPMSKYLSRDRELYSALMTGLRDYFTKNGFEKVVIGLSGGIDSALVAILATDALGKEKVVCVTMPSRYTQEKSTRDAHSLAENLGVQIQEQGISEIYEAYLEKTSGIFKTSEITITEENIQARIRGNILMAYSNRHGWLVLATGNKSETATGYCTLYGDMAGGFSPLKDTPKTAVYRLSRYRNKLSGGNLIPQSIIQKKPSAELRPGQLDQDSLPPYPVLDRIVELYIEKRLSVEEIIAKGLDPDTTREVVDRIEQSIHKHNLGAPGIRVTSVSFGKDRRMPITNKFNK